MTQLDPQVAAEAARLTPKQFADAPERPPVLDLDALVAQALEVLEQPPVLDLDALIAQVRTTLALEPAKADKDKLEAPNPGLINTLLASASEHERQAKYHTEEREKIKALFADMLEKAEADAGLEPGAITELTVNDATVFTYQLTNIRGLNQRHLKSLFPDIPGNEECWVDSPRRVKAFK